MEDRCEREKEGRKINEGNKGKGRKDTAWKEKKGVGEGSEKSA